VPKAALAPPSPEARRNLVTRKVDVEVGDDPANPPKSLVEYFRRDASGRVADTQYDLVSRGEVGQEPTATDGGPFEPWAPWGGRRWDSQPPPPRQQQQGGWGGFFGWQQPQPQPPAPRYYDPRSPQRPQYDRYPRY
jgi:hypothetical protein